MFKLALAGLWRHKPRVFFLSLSIIVGVAFSAAALIWRTTSLASVDHFYETIDVNARGDIIVEEGWSASYYDDYDENPLSVEGDFVDPQLETTLLTDDLVAQIKELPYSFEEVTGFVEQNYYDSVGFYTPADKEMFASNNDFGWTMIHSHQAGSKLGAYFVTQGQAPVKTNEVAVNEDVAKKYKLQIGDVLTHKKLVAEEGSKTQLQKTEYKLVGLVKSKPFALAQALFLFDPSLIVLHPTAARDVVEVKPHNGWTVVRVKVAKDTSLDVKEALAADIENLQSRALRVDVVERRSADWQEAEKETLQVITDQISYTVLFFVALAMVVAVFVIINTFNVLLAQRAKEIALLRTISLAKSQVVGLVVLESLLIGVFSAIVGALAGIGIAQIALKLTSNFFIEASTTLVVVAPSNFIYPSILAVAVAVVSGLLPAIKASRQAPIAVLTESQQLKAQSVKIRSIIGASLLVLGLAIIFFIIFGSFQGSSSQEAFSSLRIWALFLALAGGGLLAFVGLTLFSAILMRWFAQLFIVIHRKTRQISDQLASGNILRAPKQAAFAANALIIGVSLISFVTILLGSFQHSTNHFIERWEPADWTVEMRSSYYNPEAETSERELGVPDAIVQELEENEHFQSVTAVAYASRSEASFITENGATFGSVEEVLIFKKADYLAQVIEPDIDPKIIEALNRGQAAVVGKDMQSGQKVRLTYRHGEEEKKVEYAVGASQSEGALIRFRAVLILEDSLPDDFSPVYDRVYLDNRDGVSTEDAEEALQAVLSDSLTLRYRGTSSIVEFVNQFFETLLTIFRTLLSLSLVVAVIGVFNVLSLAIIERTRELGILRAVGMSKLQVGRMIIAESAFIIFFGSLVGMLVGLFFAWIAWLVLTSSAITGSGGEEVLEGFVFSIPWRQMLLYFAVAAILAVIAAFWPAIRAMQLKIIEAIKKG